MFLSKLTLDPRHPQARRDLSDAYEMHRTLARAFARNAETAPARFLWRLERRTDYQPSSVVLVQSAQPANWSVLNSLPGYADELLANKNINLENLIQERACYRFRLLANPTVSREGKRYGLTREDEQMAWIARQGKQNGFSILNCVRGSDERLQIRQGRGGNRITLHTTLFEGLLQVELPKSLRQGLLKGFGHGKAMGLGLLSLARLV
jgi:CRISPR system Cascade subunit CasE